MWYAIKSIRRILARRRRTYLNPKEIKYWSKRYNKWVTVEENFPSDGSTGGTDIWSISWWVHDKLCITHKWDDGTACTCRQASMVLADILWEEGRYIRSVAWGIATYVFGPKF
jgi:hypothetical protein